MAGWPTVFSSAFKKVLTKLMNKILCFIKFTKIKNNKF